MTQVTIATFNCENLFTRFKFGQNVSQAKIDSAVKDGFIIDRALFERIKDPERTLTAQAIKATGADIIGLQEIENLDTLKSFQSQFLNNYPYQYLIDANDPRFIDVGVLSKLEAKCLVTHQFDKKGNTKIFSRDCLEIEYAVGGTILTVFVNHFKAMLGGRDETMARRKMQAERMVEIIKNKYGSKPGKENFIIMGDLNDYLPSPGLNPLLQNDWIENVIATRLPKGEQWTHWYDAENSVAQLDYLLLSKNLANKNPGAKPLIVRKGLALKATAYAGARFSGVGKVRPAASDHCPVAISIKL